MVPILVGAGLLRLSGWGEVVSAFSRAVNIRHSQGLLVSLIEETRAMTYLSVCLPALFRERKKRLVPGDRVRFEGHSLVTGDFVVDFVGRPTWQGTLKRNDVKGFSASKVSLVKEALLLKGRDGGFLGLLRGGDTINPFADKAMKVLGEIQGAPSPAARSKALSGLVGLGPGSTPSGDDFITGLMLGEETLRLVRPTEAKAVAGSQDAMVAWEVEKEDLRVAIDRTNDAGKTLLWQALHGHFPEYLIETLRAVSKAKGRQEIMDAVEGAVGRGATSGTDVLTGFLFSMEGRL
jgi:Protein of unknown function (DUF2877)